MRILYFTLIVVYAACTTIIIVTGSDDALDLKEYFRENRYWLVVYVLYSSALIVLNPWFLDKILK
jgi:hypothetical protein